MPNASSAGPRRRRLKVGALMLILVLIGMLLTPLPALISRPLVVPAGLRPADAIVILGSGVYADSSLSDDSLRRLVYGLRLYRRGLAPRIIISGGGTIPDRPTPADMMARLALDLGIEPDAIVVENRSTSTYENALYIRRIFDARGWRTGLLVTSAMHSLRATRVFHKQQITVYPAPVSFFEQYRFSPGGRWGLLTAAGYEYSGLVYYWMRGRI